VAVLLGVCIASLDLAFVNIALPAIGSDLRISPAASIWVLNAYQLAVVATLLPFAALGDEFGPRRVFLFGLPVFAGAALGCMFAGNLPLLAAARVLQGIGAGALMSVNIALIRAIYPPERLGRGVGLNALIVGLSIAAGPTLASMILSLGHWPWLFATYAPLGALAFALGWRHLPHAASRGHGVDAATAGLTALGFAALVLALGLAAQRAPWPLTLGALGATVLLGAALLRRQAGHPAPMLPTDLLRRPMFSLSAITSVCAFVAQGASFAALPFFFQGVLQRSAVETGLLMTPWAVVVALAAPLAGRLSDRHPPGMLGGVGLSVLAAGLLSLVLLPAHPSSLDIAWRMLACGMGFGFFQAPNLRALMASAPVERSGSASGVIALCRLLGQAGGAAGVALCFGLSGGSGEGRGATYALALAAMSAALAATASFARLRAR
jgi:DHA2 family multidrug resistance protein-like MFS transporter